MRELIQRIKNDDLSAVEELYQQVKSTGMKVAVSYVGREGLEEDMFHEAFIKAIENLDKFDETRSFQAWFDVILANTCKSHLRKKKVENLQDVTDEEGNAEIPEEISTIGNPEECWDQNELKQIIKNLLDKLSDEQREAIILFYFQNMPIAQIAEHQNCGEDTVKSRLHQGRNKLKIAVEAYEEQQNVRLHSIGIAIALYVFFKSDMGKAYACEMSPVANQLAQSAAEAGAKPGNETVGELTKDTTKEATKEASKEAAKETAKEAVKEATKEAAESAAGEAAKSAIAEAGKAAAMSMSTKIAIAAAVVLLLCGGIAAGIFFSNQETPADNMVAMETQAEGTEALEETAGVNSEEADTEETGAEALEETVEETEEETATEGEGEAANAQSNGVMVYNDGNGIIRLAVDNDNMEFYSANGGVILTYNDDGYGAIDYEGNEIVPNSYPYWFDFPDNNGYIMLGDDTTVDVIDKNGNVVHSMAYPDSWALGEGCVTYSYYDGTVPKGTVYCYDIEADNLPSYEIDGYTFTIQVSAVRNGKYVFSCTTGIYTATVDGEVSKVGDYYST